MIKNIKMVVPANGSAKNQTLQGNFIRCLDSQNSILFCRLLYENHAKANSEFELEKGLGFETKPFYGMQLRNDSENDITVSLIVSDEGAVIDTRTSGALSIGAASNITYYDTVLVTDLVNGAEILPFNAFRKTATYSIDQDCFINSRQGVKVSGGSVIVWENQQALTLIPATTACNVSAFDETN